jgi:hypothetical protein
MLLSRDCVPRHAVLIAPVSGSRLCKTGIFQVFARDFRRFRSQIVEFWSIETEDKLAKGRIWRAPSGFSTVLSQVERLPGWRRSADRTRLHGSSLLTGNFTGNFAIFRPQEAVLEQEAAVLQLLLERFPTQINRENILKNREYYSRNRESRFLRARGLL